MRTDAISEVRKIEEAIEHLRTSRSLLGINRKRLVKACEILQEVFADLASGADEKRRKDHVTYDQRSLMEGMKRYLGSPHQTEEIVRLSSQMEKSRCRFIRVSIRSDVGRKFRARGRARCPRNKLPAEILAGLSCRCFLIRPKGRGIARLANDQACR
jgi:hypothetical protein